MRILPELTAAQAASDELAWELRWKRRNERGRVCSCPRIRSAGVMSVVPVSLVLLEMKKSLCELKDNLEMLEGSLIMYRLGPGYVVESWTPVDRERGKIIIGISENLDIVFS